MPRTKKPKISATGGRASGTKKIKHPVRPRKEINAEEPKKEPVYININEYQPDLAAKTRKLWLVVGIFAVILVCGWLIILRASLKNTTNQASWSQISQEIKNSLAKFDTAIKNRAQIQPLSADDMAVIKDDLEERIKSNPDSSNWPTHELNVLGLSVQYPDNWQKVSEGKGEAVLVDFSATSSLEKYGRLAITLNSNSKKYNLNTWLAKNKINLNGYVAEKPLFIFTSTTPESSIYSNNSTSTLDRIIYLDFPANKIVAEVRATARGDNSYYQPLLDEIVRTIKILK